MDREVLVYIDLKGFSHLVGRLWEGVRSGEEVRFEYDKSWLARAERLSLEPALKLGPGPFHIASNKPLFGAIGDSAPDQWGRMLMRRAEQRRAERKGQIPTTVREIDYLLLVDDEARQGALRFAEREGGPFVADRRPNKIPALIELPRLLSSAEQVTNEKDNDEDLQLLLLSGASLGGARPKVSVRDRDGHLAIAKFPHIDDTVKAVVWEAVALTLAEKAGIPVPVWRLESIADRPVLLLRRFDRKGTARVPFLSAMSMLDARDDEFHSYLEFVDVLRRHAADPKHDIHALWRRIVFSILISNTDDHLRNHGFLWAGPVGWRLSPAYDLNSIPTDMRPRILKTAINRNDGTASLKLAYDVASYFELTYADARAIAREVGESVALWRKEAEKAGLNNSEMDRMASAFEHEDLKAALAGK